MRTIESALQAARASGEPLGLITVSVVASGGAARELASTLRSRLRHADRIFRLDAHRFLVVAPDTDLPTAEALAADLRRHAQRGDGARAEVEIEVQAPMGQASATEVLERIRTAKQPVYASVPSD
jgi:GGDEF domain-containing protein